MQIQHHLTAAPAWRNQSAPSIAGSCHRYQGPCLGGGGNTYRDELGAGTTGEMMDIYSLINSSIGIHCRGRDRMVCITAESSCQAFGSLDYPTF